MWGGGGLDLDAYLARIGFRGEARPDLATLRAVHRGHVAAFPFENLEIMLGRPIVLDVTALQDKMVRGPRGGYCYEQNLLFAAALERIGFSFTGLGARIRMGSDRPRAVTHMLLKIAADGQEWLADVGFGAEGLLEPMLFRDGVEVRQGEWTFGLTTADHGVRILRSLHPEGWFDLYSFTLEERYPVDYTVMNHYIATHPHSPFVARPVVQRTAPGTRRSLVGPLLTITHPDGTAQERVVPATELGALLREIFGIELAAEDLAMLEKSFF
ncbi:arylamine N-acetyltransferase [Streptomyces palmae]|uniref:Arylamine N-acetyltransferase n=2 Tax=Streptomyces palmae TaxID=1701085 RepID=A0A4Z0HC62_9ACTN|nr:arylamine N-acetyltransferase [Streptomyces palmae]